MPQTSHQARRQGLRWRSCEIPGVRETAIHSKENSSLLQQDTEHSWDPICLLWSWLLGWKRLLWLDPSQTWQLSRACQARCVLGGQRSHHPSSGPDEMTLWSWRLKQADSFFVSLAMWKSCCPRPWGTHLNVPSSFYHSFISLLISALRKRVDVFICMTNASEAIIRK